MKELKDGIRSEVHIDFQGNVHKRFRGHEKEKRCENEARILKALEERRCPYVPRLLEHHPDDDYIVTTNCGQPAPDISRPKCEALFSELEKVFGVRHDDPEPRNVTYSEDLGRFCLIDFELAELLPDPQSHPDQPPARVERLRWAALSDPGTRKEPNDDAWIALELSPDRCERLSRHGERFLDPHPLLFAVADGIGGGRAGELASRLVLANLRRLFPEHLSAAQPPSWNDLLKAIFNRIHDDLNALARREANLEKMGCTLTLAVFEHYRLHLAHAGDSRLYRCRQSGTEQLSVDHTFAFKKWKRGEIHEHQFRSHPRRNALYEALGGGHPQIFPQIASFETEPGDRYLLCTDGLIDGLLERPLARLLASGEAEEAAEALLARARSCSKDDDATLIVTDFSTGNS